MSKFPLWWDTTITVYNKTTDPITSVVSWKRTVLDNCFWKEVGDKSTVGGVTIDTDSVVCRIPQNTNFVNPLNWGTQNGDDTFTLQQGDILVQGNCDFTIDEYAKGNRSTDLLAKYRPLRGCVEIKKVSINTMRGMMYPHYNVTGV